MLRSAVFRSVPADARGDRLTESDEQILQNAELSVHFCGLDNLKVMRHCCVLLVDVIVCSSIYKFVSVLVI